MLQGHRPFPDFFPGGIVFLTLLAWFWSFPILTVLIRLYVSIVLSNLYPTLLLAMMKFFLFSILYSKQRLIAHWQTVSQGRGSWDREVVSTGWRCRWICTSVQPESL